MNVNENKSPAKSCYVKVSHDWSKYDLQHGSLANIKQKAIQAYTHASQICKITD